MQPINISETRSSGPQEADPSYYFSQDKHVACSPTTFSSSVTTAFSSSPESHHGSLSYSHSHWGPSTSGPSHGSTAATAGDEAEPRPPMPARRRSDVEIEESLARHPGHVSRHGTADDVARCARLHDPARLRRLRAEQDANLARMKKEMFRGDEELEAAMEDIRRKKQWKEWGVDLE